MAGRLLIKNGVVSAGGVLSRQDILCDGPRIAAIGRGMAADGAAVFDAAGLTLGPGFIDVHVHGGGGHSFFTHDPANVHAYAAWAPTMALRASS